MSAHTFSYPLSQGHTNWGLESGSWSDHFVSWRHEMPRSWCIPPLVAPHHQKIVLPPMDALYLDCKSSARCCRHYISQYTQIQPLRPNRVPLLARIRLPHHPNSSRSYATSLSWFPNPDHSNVLLPLTSIFPTKIKTYRTLHTQPESRTSASAPTTTANPLSLAQSETFSPPSGFRFPADQHYHTSASGTCRENRVDRPFSVKSVTSRVSSYPSMSRGACLIYILLAFAHCVHMI